MEDKPGWLGGAGVDKGWSGGGGMLLIASVRSGKGRGKNQCSTTRFSQYSSKCCLANNLQN